MIMSMNLNPIEWTEAQRLLLKLVQVLSPLAVRPIESSAFLTRRFFIPSMTPSDFFERHPVKWLLTLREVQKEVEAWILDSEKQDSEKQEPKKRGAEKREPETAEPRERRPKKEMVEASRERALREEKAARSLPLGRQAKELIHQVQQTIGRLSSSKYIQEPEETPLREALKELMPHLNRIIRTLSKPGEKLPEFRELPEKGAPVSLRRHALPVPVRQEIIEKLRVFKEVKPLPVPKETPQPLSQPLPQPLPRKLRPTEAEVKKEPEGKVSPSQSVLPAPKSVDPRSVILPAFPPLADTKRARPSKRKKRRGFWFKEDKPDHPGS